MHGFSNFNYIERLKRHGIDTLEKRILYCDLTLCYRILYSHSKLAFTNYFKINNSNTRKNNNYKVKERPSKINVRSHSFTNRVTRAWNSLSEVIVTAPSLSSFKSRLKQFYRNKFLMLNKTDSCANTYRVIWFTVSGTGYDALMPWYNQANYTIALYSLHVYILSFQFNSLLLKFRNCRL